MENILEYLFYDYYLAKKGVDVSEIIMNDEKKLEFNEELLKKSLSKKQKKQLLRIIDAKDRISERNNLDSFVAGLKIGLNINYELGKR